MRPAGLRLRRLRGERGGGTVTEIKCSRCRCAEYIPTHQYVKFEDEVRYLCATCFELFKGWFYRGARAAQEGAP